MESFFASRGCIYAHDHGGSTAGAFAMSPKIGGSSDSPVLILGAALSDDDIVLPQAALDGYKVLYTFGQGFGQAQIHGMVLLGSSGGGAGFAAAVNYFQSNRISAKKSSVQVSLPGGIAYNVFLTGFAVGQTDAQFNTQQFILGGMVLGHPK